jgi:tetratricopeptide (TPR) repeat protein
MSTYASESVTVLDQFNSSLRVLLTKLAKNTRLLLVIGIVILLAGVGTGLLLQKKSAQESRARDSLYRAEVGLVKELGTVGQYDRLDVDQKLPGTVKALKAVTETFPKTKSSYLAQMKLGDLYLSHGGAEMAIVAYQKAVDQTSIAADRSLALYSLAMAQENAKKPAEALKTFETAVKAGESYLAGELWLGVYRTSLASGNAEKAKTTLEKLKKDFANTDYEKKAQALQTQAQ